MRTLAAYMLESFFWNSAEISGHFRHLKKSMVACPVLSHVAGHKKNTKDNSKVLINLKMGIKIPLTLSNGWY